MNESAQQFRRAVVKELKTSNFDVDVLRESCGLSVAEARPFLEFVFESLCLRASSDGEVTDAELESLSRYGAQLNLGKEDQTRILKVAGDRVFSVQLKQAQDDGVVTSDEAEALYQLRESLGLPPVKRRSLMVKLPTSRKRSNESRAPAGGPRAAREQSRLRRDIALLSGLVGGALVAVVGFVLLLTNHDSRLFQAMTATGVVVAVVSGTVISWLRYSCPECGHGRLKPIARPEDRKATSYDSDGHSRTRTVSQFYDCNCCGYREWIEHG